MALLGSTLPAGGAVPALQAALTRSYRHLEAEVDRARALGSDAVAKLLISFRTVQQSLGAQASLLGEVTGAILSGDRLDFASSARAIVNEFVEETRRVTTGSGTILEGLARLNQSVARIVSSTEQIERLARAGKMIALNARVETARAGAAGATFNVVAVEIKRIAATSTDLSAQIRAEVASIRKGVEETTHTAQVLASHDMNVAAASHRNLVAAIGGVERVRQQMDETLREIELRVDDAIRALQFEDMLTQTLNALSAKLGLVADVVHDALEAAGPGEELTKKVPGLIARLEESVEQGSVAQTSVDKGTCELF